jgi:hypothetical protein
MEAYRRVDTYRTAISQDSIHTFTLCEQVQSFEALHHSSLRIAVAMQLFHFCAMVLRYAGLEIELRSVRTRQGLEQSIRQSSVNPKVAAHEIPEPHKIPGIIRTVVQCSGDGLTRQKEITGMSEE